MQHSPSPQLAAPLRKGKTFLALLSRVIGTSTHRMHLEPVQEPVGEDSERRSAGADLRFRLRSSKGRSPTGWCLVSCAAAAGRKPVPMELCWDSGQGFSEHSRIRLQTGPSGRSSTLIRLPEQVTRLGLEMLEPAGNRAPGAFVIREISGVAALAILLRPHLREVVKHPRVMSRWSKQALTWLRTGGMKSLSQGLWRSARQRAYDQQQNATFEALKENDRHAILERMRGLRYQPLISIVMPVYNTPEKLLRAAVGSVVNQCYPHWELCIADDASAPPHVRRVLEEYVAGNPRIKVTYRQECGHIAEATNSALALATGEFISLMDHDDEIAPEALYEFVNALNENRALDMIYSDEDKIDEHGRRYGPFFKPDWSPDYLESCMCTSHLAIYRKTLVDRIGGFRPECNGSQDYDFVLRFTEQTDRIAHVAKILYHWRAVPGSTAFAMTEKNYVIEAGIRALEDRLRRTGRSGSVKASRYPACYDVTVRLAHAPLVSIVIPTAGRSVTVNGRHLDLVTNCVQSIQDKSTYRNFEIVIVDNGDLAAATLEALRSAGCRNVTYDASLFNLSRKVNLGAQNARGDYLLLLDDDIEVITPEWLERLLEQALKPGVGAVGAKLLYPDDTIQHAGIVHCEGLPAHVRKHYPRDDPGYFFSTASVRNYLGVTGACLLTSAAAFRSVGGFDEQFEINYSDTDYCLKLRERDLRTVYTPHAELYHFECTNRAATVAAKESGLYLKKWSSVTQDDPYYNNAFLSTRPPDYSLGFTGLQVDTA